VESTVTIRSPISELGVLTPFKVSTNRNNKEIDNDDVLFKTLALSKAHIYTSAWNGPDEIIKKK
jgi:hypothetical protein